MRGIRDSVAVGVYVFLVFLVSEGFAAVAGRPLRVAQHSDAATYLQRGVKAQQDGNEAEAVRWYQRAADLGDPDAQVCRRPAERDPWEAICWLRPCAGLLPIGSAF